MVHSAREPDSEVRAVRAGILASVTIFFSAAVKSLQRAPRVPQRPGIAGILMPHDSPGFLRCFYEVLAMVWPPEVLSHAY